MSNNQGFYAYLHARPSSLDANGVFYIGKGKNNRFKDFYNRNSYHKNLVQKHGQENILISKIYCSSESIAKDLEIGLIKCFKAMGVKLANLTFGGEGMSGYKATEETKQKQRAAKIGKPKSEETKRKMAIAATGRKLDAATIEKMRQANLGKKLSSEARARLLSYAHLGHTPESRAKISASLKGRDVSKWIYKIAAANRGKKMPEEQKKKVSAFFKGRKQTPEQIAKRVASRKATLAAQGRTH